MLSALALYRGMVLRGYEIDSFPLGFNALQALILAKVILRGDMMHLGDGPAPKRASFRC